MTQPRFQSRARPDGAAAGPAVHLVTFGCQMNKYDSLLVEGRFQDRGYRVAETMAEADVVLFNTCSVREHAEERAISWVGELKRRKQRNPELVIGVLGCFAQRAEAEIFARATHVDLVCGTRNFQHLPELVDEVRARRAAPDATRRADMQVLATSTETEVAVKRHGEVYTGGLSGYLAVMRGCDLACTYCIVPRVRGAVASRPLSDLLEEARWMVDQGCRAITLLGQTVNSYGEDLSPAAEGRGRRGRPGLADLIYALQELDGLARIRCITAHPAYVNRAFAEALRDCDKADRFLPLPAQSGSDRVLRAMKRGYNVDLYRRKVELLREVVPDMELGSDWIVGFPGESEEEFRRSEEFLEEVGFAQNYVFKYDPRPETAAWERADDIPDEVKKERNQRLLRRGERASLRRFEAQLGRVQEVFAERVSERDSSLLVGRTRHNLPLVFPGPSSQVGQVVSVVAQEASPYGLAGTPVEAGAALGG